MNIVTEGREEAIRLLEELGFTAYEAECLVTLIQQAEATATLISEHSDLPRSRVYGVADSLSERGLVEVCEGEPKRYRAVPADSIVEHLSREYENRVDALAESLTALESSDNTNSEGCSVWSFTGRESVGHRLCQLVEETETELQLFVADRQLFEACLTEIRSAIDRGVTTTLLTRAVDGQLRSWLADELPGARFAEAPEAWHAMSGENVLSHLLVSDRAVALVVTTSQEVRTASTEYTGTLSRGDKCGFVLTLVQTLDAEGVLET